MELPINYENVNWRERKEAREQYIEEQDGKCYYCKELLEGSPAPQIMFANIDLSLFPPGMFDYPVHLHHDHNTGMTIGAVHARCNAYLWQFRGE